MPLRADFQSAIQSRIDLNFLRDLPEYDEVKPYHISGIIPANHERTNMQFEERQVPLYNLRGQEHRLSIEEHGFEMITVRKHISYLDIKGSLKRKYITRMTEMVKKRLDATLVLVVTAECVSLSCVCFYLLNLLAVSIELSGQDHNLLYCDFSTVQQDDLFAVDRVSSEYISEVYMLKPRDHYDWYWIDHQRPDEASLFVSYDSAETGALREVFLEVMIDHICADFGQDCQHTSAKSPRASESVAPRESVEFRMIVLSYPVQESAEKPGAAENDSSNFVSCI